MKVLLIDNYDSFTYNLYQQIGVINKNVKVVRNDKITIEEIKKYSADKIVISPGPGRPEDSNISLNVIKELGKDIPVLGVCLGHQAIGYCYNAEVVNAPELMHGKTSKVNHYGEGIYKDIPQGFTAGRYHSLVLKRETILPEFIITSETTDSVVMGIRHTVLKLEGIQFHPESILTEYGNVLINNWINE